MIDSEDGEDVGVGDGGDDGERDVNGGVEMLRVEEMRVVISEMMVVIIGG